MSAVIEELARREGGTNRVLAYFRAHEGEWVDTRTLEQLGGRNAWRTRVSERRKVFCEELGWPFPVKKERGDPDPIVNRQQRIVTFDEATGHLTQIEQVVSEYRYFSQAPLGRAADVPAPDTQPGLLFNTHRSY